MTETAAITIADARGPADIAAARELFLDYQRGLGFDLAYQGFAEELAGLPGKYAPPAGRLLLARAGEEAAGVVALRPLEAGICEMKRLYVRSGFRGRHVGEALVERLIADARAIGYAAMRLDTVAAKMPAAVALYRRTGFGDIPAYYASPIPGTAYMELRLGSN
ncbi:MAG TPA: N-acetyltransferase [Alphaproteobacteria bacterium]|nr:N-acetyltransferase [Alphaproteobacteria bacterium]